MLITSFCLTLTCLRVDPNSSQFFRYASISLRCEGETNSSSWKVKRRTSDGGIRVCSSGWGYAASACTIAHSYPTDSGVYWCESDRGEQSNAVNITVSGGGVILESPALPVTQGSAVALYCKTETSKANQTFDFFKDGFPIRTLSGGEMTISRTSRTDEGFYACSVSGGEMSAGSWLAVSASVDESSFPSVNVPLIGVCCHLLVGVPYFFSTILLGLVWRDRKRAADRRILDFSRMDRVVMESPV